MSTHRKKTAEPLIQKAALIALALAAALALTARNAKAAGLEVLTNTLTHQKILAIGESFHGRADLTKAVHDLILKAAVNADWIGIEVSSEYQGEIDAYLAGRTELPADWSADNRALLKRVRELNRHDNNRRYINRLQVLALDLPVTTNDTPGEWFLRRDAHMYRTLRDATNHFTKPGILFMGMGHIAKVPFQLPRIATIKMSLDLQDSLTTLGTRLQQTPELKDEVTTVAVHASGSWIERWSQLPPDYQPLYKFMSKLPPNEIMNLKEDRYQQREARTRPNSFPIRLSDAFDYFINVPTKRTAFQECEAALTQPAQLVRGLALNVADIYARIRK